jgi:hypothetical protein
MAGDWIKMRVDLDDDPAVDVICVATGLERLAVVGRLWKLWAWADQQLHDGNAATVTVAFVDRKVEHVGFAEAMQKAGWLKILSTGISFPHFDRHNGKPAKERALTRDRVKRNRDAKGVTSPLPEKRREDINPLPPKDNSNSTTQDASRATEKDPTDQGQPAGRQERKAEPRGITAADRTAAVLRQQREDSGASVPMPEHLRKYLPGHLTGHPPELDTVELEDEPPNVQADPPPAKPNGKGNSHRRPETLAESAARLGIKARPGETEPAFRQRVKDADGR